MDAGPAAGKLTRPPLLDLSTAGGPSVPVCGRRRQRPRCEVAEEGAVAAGCAVLSRRGRHRNEREDAYSLLPFFARSSDGDPLSLFAVFDGHGGASASRYACTRMPLIFASSLGNDIHYALKMAFCSTHREIVYNLAQPTHTDNESRSADSVQIPSRTAMHNASNSLARMWTAPGACASPSSNAATSIILPRNVTSPQTSCEALQCPAQATEGCDASPCTPKAVDGHSPFADYSSRNESQATSDIVATERNEVHVTNMEHRSEEVRASCGTTATAVVLGAHAMVIAHAGDSRAALGLSSGCLLRLCEDHRPTRPDELARVSAAGGLVLSVGGAARVNGVMAVSRALGHADFVGVVIPEPEVRSHSLCGDEKFVLIASDGLWDYVNDDECASVLHAHLAKDGARAAAQALVQCAWDHGSSDDITALVVDLVQYRAAGHL